jgi:hypothetical protein
MKVIKVCKDDDGNWVADTITSGSDEISIYMRVDGLWYDEGGKIVDNYIKDILGNCLPLGA